MAAKNLPDIESISKAVHTALRQWGHADDLDLKALKALRIFHGKTTSSVLTDGLAELKLTNPLQFEILDRRFVLGDAIKRVSLALHISEDHANRQQREGIDALAEILLRKEEQARKGRSETLLSRLPPRTYERLFGVEEVRAKLVESLGKHSSPSVLAMTGLGGLGKTALADAVVRDAIELLSFNRLIWIRVDSTLAKIANFQDHLLAELAVNFSLQGKPVSEQAEAIKNAFKHEACLLVIDNLEEEIQNLDWLYLLQEFAEPSKVLLTSRVLPATLANVHVIKLRELEQQPATEFLVDHARRVGLSDNTQELEDRAGDVYARTGGNPLALKLTVGLLQTWPLEVVLQSLHQGPGSDVEAMYKHVYEKSWQSLSQDAKQMLRAMPLVGEASGGLDQLQVISGLSELQTREALKELATRSLVELRSAAKQPRYGIHRLTESFLRGQVVQTL